MPPKPVPDHSLCSPSVTHMIPWMPQRISICLQQVQTSSHFHKINNNNGAPKGAPFDFFHWSNGHTFAHWTDHTQHLYATLSSVAWSIKLNFVDTLTQKANQRASSPIYLASSPLPSKCQCLMVTPPTSSIFLPSQLSAVSSLRQSIQGVTNQAIQDVLYGENESSLATAPLQYFWHLILVSATFLYAISSNNKKKIN
jgi:hypothetical protein